MSTRVLRLLYPPALVRQPIIHQLIRQFDITVNILQAQIGLEEAWLEIQATGEETEIARAVKWLEEEGLEVREGG